MTGTHLVMTSAQVGFQGQQAQHRQSSRWHREYGGLRTDQAKRLKDLEKQNARLKRLLADAELDKAILREAASGCRRPAQLNFRARRSGARRSSMCVTC